MSAQAKAERSSAGPGIVAGADLGGGAGTTGGKPWLAPCLALSAVLLAMAVAFRAEVAAAVGTWESSTAYNHCWLVLPIALWLAWERRRRLATVRPAPSPRFALLVLPFAVAWLAAERLGIMEGRQLAVLGMAEAAALGILGWRACRAMAGPLAYLVFLVPFGAFAVPVLQQVTAAMVVFGLKVLGISVYADELIIEIPEGTFYVAEACAGLRFIIASLAFGALYALTMFRSPWRRLVVMVLAVVVPIVANGFRGLGIVVLGHYLGSAEAAAADHVVYGWVFFSVVILLLTLAGLPFREDVGMRAGMRHPSGAVTGRLADPVRSGFRTAPYAPALLLAAAIVIVGAFAGPALSAALDRGGMPESVALTLTPPEGCRPADGDPSVLRCAGATLSARMLVFSRRATWATVAAARNRAEGTDDEAATFRVATDGGQAEWRGRQPLGGGGSSATAAWLGGKPAGDGLRSRLEQALNSVGIGSGRPVVAIVELRATGDAGAVTVQPRRPDLLASALRTQAALAAQAAQRSQGGR